MSTSVSTPPASAEAEPTPPKEPRWFTWWYPPAKRAALIQKRAWHLKAVEKKLLEDFAHVMLAEGVAFKDYRRPADLVVRARAARLDDEFMLEDDALDMLAVALLLVFLLAVSLVVAAIVILIVWGATTDRHTPPPTAFFVTIGLGVTYSTTARLAGPTLFDPLQKYVAHKRRLREAQLFYESIVARMEERV